MTHRCFTRLQRESWRDVISCPNVIVIIKGTFNRYAELRIIKLRYMMYAERLVPAMARSSVDIMLTLWIPYLFSVTQYNCSHAIPSWTMHIYVKNVLRQIPSGDVITRSSRTTYCIRICSVWGWFEWGFEPQKDTPDTPVGYGVSFAKIYENRICYNDSTL